MGHPEVLAMGGATRRTHERSNRYSYSRRWIEVEQGLTARYSRIAILVPGEVSVFVWPKTLPHWGRFMLVEPQRPSDVFLVVNCQDRAESTFHFIWENVCIVSIRFIGLARLD